MDKAGHTKVPRESEDIGRIASKRKISMQRGGGKRIKKREHSRRGGRLLEKKRGSSQGTFKLNG